MKPLFFLITFILAAAPGFAQSKTKMVPDGWYPALHPSIVSALAQLKEANSTTEMNSFSRQVADMTDAQLYIAYIRLYEKLSPKERAELLTEQTKWLKTRAKAATDAIESEGGSLAPIEANNAEVTYTETRLKELRARLKKLTNKDEDE